MNVKLKKILVIVLMMLATTLLTNVTFANNITSKIKNVEYTEEFKKWLDLSDEERAKVLMPRMYETEKTYTETKNPLKLLKSRATLATSGTRFTLKDYISKNVVVRDQKQTNSCWAFATISSLETNLAMQDYYNSLEETTYDFSERHMEYATSRNFANNEINITGFNRAVGDGGNFEIAENYLTNGQGAVTEIAMPFENNEDTIDISQIQNKTVETKVFDTIKFPSYFASEVTEEIRTSIKQYIVKYGSIYAGIHGASGIATAECYNNETGALYCNNRVLFPEDHAVSIVGWDDNYNIENFIEGNRPTNPGAWIVKNSWGEKIEYTMDEIKEEIFNELSDSQKTSYNITKASDITDEQATQIAIEAGFIAEGNKFILKVGDNGFMYISYEDVNIYKDMYGITKATKSVEDEKIYQYNNYGYTTELYYGTSKIYLANIFNKQSGTEYLTDVSIYAPQTYTCSIYVNPNGASIAKNDLEKVSLAAGETETFDEGYHTLEFAQPVAITGNSFAVVVEIQSSGYSTHFVLESQLDEIDLYNNVQVENGKCFITDNDGFTSNNWQDLSKMTEENESLYNGDSTIKAFTIPNIVDDSLRDIVITNPPTKTSYFVGDNFEKAGMVVTANYNNGDSATVEVYNITNGTNLQKGQTSVTITYEGKSAEQPITVEENSVVSLSIKTPPTKVTYLAGDDFDRSGMEIIANYKDGTSKEITEYTIEDEKNLKNGQTSVTISFEGKTVLQNITVEPNELEKIEITKAPNKTNYVVGQNFDKTGMVVKATYQNGTKEITGYTIENGTDLKLEQTSVTIKFEDKTAIQEITVEEKQIVSIEVSKNPTKEQYIQSKDSLDLSGGVIKVTYNDETYEEIPMTSEEITVEGFDNQKAGTITITVKYQGMTTSYQVTVVEEKIEEPENSNFSNASGVIKNTKSYTFTDKSKNEYMIIEIELDGMIRNSINDGYEYYYYLSGNQAEENIVNWVKIDNEQFENGKLKFAINTSDLENYNELINSDSLYIYVKEVAIKGGNQKSTISQAIKLNDINGNLEVYVDNNKVDTVGINDKAGSNSNGETTANVSLPKAGKTLTIILSIVAIAIIGTTMYIRYRQINKYVK